MRTRLLPILLLVLAASAALAGDGRIEINQTNALAGGVTPGDAPGFPVTLSASGSYVLTSSLTVPDANTSAIVLEGTADYSTVDLNGFSIHGPIVCSAFSCNGSGTGVGIEASTTTTNTRVLNGIIRGMGGDGLSLAHRNYVHRVTAYSNGGHGMSVGERSSVIECQAEFNGKAGIHIAESVAAGLLGNAGEALLRGNLSVSNGRAGDGDWDIEGSRAAGANICSDDSCSARGARRFYMTAEAVTGGAALGACTRGYRMAAFSELTAGSDLEYTTKPQMGVQTSEAPDGGKGAPFESQAWVRTGNLAFGTAGAGVANCDAWASSLSNDDGTTILLDSVWAPGDADEALSGRFETRLIPCSSPRKVWCIED